MIVKYLSTSLGVAILRRVARRRELGGIGCGEHKSLHFSLAIDTLGGPKPGARGRQEMAEGVRLGPAEITVQFIQLALGGPAVGILFAALSTWWLSWIFNDGMALRRFTVALHGFVDKGNFE